MAKQVDCVYIHVINAVSIINVMFFKPGCYIYFACLINYIANWVIMFSVIVMSVYTFFRGNTEYTILFILLTRSKGFRHFQDDVLEKTRI